MPPVLAPGTKTTELQPVTTVTRRLLVVVDDACTAPDLCASVRVIAGDRPIEALVVAPAHGGSFAEWYVDEDAARAEATHRLRACVSCLTGDGIRARGQLGDPDPVQAITDALDTFDAEEILLVIGPGGPFRRLHPSVLERVQQTFAQPVSRVAIPQRRSRGAT
jgi:hypothetical protein